MERARIMVHRILIASVVGFLGISTLSVLANSTPINIDYNIARVGGYTSDPLTPQFGWPYPHAGMGTAIVTTNSADLKTDQSNGEVGALYLDTSLNTQAPAVSLSFDINVLAQAASGYGQTKTVSTIDTPILFGVRIFANNNWAASFQLAPTSDTAGVFGFRDSNNASLTTFGTYDINTIYHVKLDVDYANNAASAYINGNLAISNFGLWGGGSANPTTSEIFAYLNGATNASNEVAFGSLEAAATDAVPLPRTAWMGLSCLALFGVGKRVGRGKRTA